MTNVQPAAPGFTYSGEELDALAGAVNYYRWIVRRFAPFLGRRVVEVGAGIGTFAEHLLHAVPSAQLTLVEPAANNYPHLRARFAGRPEVRTVQGYLGDAGAPGSADSVVAVNVMEHVRDDAAFLADAHRLLAPGGHALLFVPALPALFGTLDEAFEHFRRYTRPVLTSALRTAGFRPLRVHYTNLPGVAAWWLSGKVLRRRTVSARDARIYDRWVIPWVSALEGVWTPPLGQSLVAIARKDG
ncbi:MAG TPA: class I SAM-dependent methyltransferase [Longimicrobium sp.]|jgi:SAM-dependent methyltransferase|uniref:class I SAM-dependent methyltransferase n=1 Tax=Longimicrobium sp. TaxID=2029185 RepID=UPI002ED886D5